MRKKIILFLSIIIFFVFAYNQALAASLKFTKPLVGEVVTTGTKYTIVSEITYSAGESSSFVSLDNLYYNGQLYDDLVYNISSKSDTEFLWEVPGFLPAGEYYFDGSLANTDVRATTNVFTIDSQRTIFPDKITKPSAGEKIKAGEDFEIQYNNIPLTIHNVSILQLQKGGIDQEEIIYVSNDVFGFKIKIPSDVSSGDDYQIKISSGIGKDEEISDFFSVVSDYDKNKNYTLNFDLPTNNFVKNKTYILNLNSNCPFTSNYSLWIDLGKNSEGIYRIHPLTIIDYNVDTKIFQYENVIRGEADIYDKINNQLPAGQVEATIPDMIGWYKVVQTGWSNLVPYYIETYHDGNGVMSIQEYKNVGEEALKNLNNGKYRFFATVSGYDQENGGVKCSAVGFSEYVDIGDIANNLVNNNQIGSNKEVKINNNALRFRLKGKIMLKVEDAGKAYYIHPQSEEMYYLGRPTDAFSVMREQGIGITNENLEKIQIGSGNLTGADSDSDGLPDMFEDAIGTDKNKADSDNDGYNDKAELDNGYNPNGSGRLSTDNNFSDGQKGKIFLQVENNGEAWYINPEDGKRYFLGRPADAFQVMRNLGLGISNSDFEKL